MSCGAAVVGRSAAEAGPAADLAPDFVFLVAGGGWLVMVRVCDACHVVGGCLQLGASLIDVRLDIGPLPPRSSSPTVAGCLLGGFPVGRDLWGEEPPPQTVPAPADKN